MSTEPQSQGHSNQSAGAPPIGMTITFLAVLCAALALADLLIDKHGPFPIEHLFAFYGLASFVACIFLVAAGRIAYALLVKPADYYDEA